MKNFRLNGVAYQCPSRLSECSAEQIGLVMVYQLSLQIYERPQQRVLTKVSFFAHLTGVSEKMIHKLTPTQMQQLLGLIVWAKDATITERPFEFFEFGGVKYYLPKPGFADTSSIELAMCCIYQTLMSKGGHEDKIFSLIATLCRPIRLDLQKQKTNHEWDGDRREPYNSTIADERASLFKSMKVGIARAIYFYFELMAKGFFERYTEVLDPADDEEKPLYENGQGQITLLMEIAEIGAFGKFEEVCRQNAHTIWIFIKDKRLKAKRLEEKTNRQDDDE